MIAIKPDSLLKERDSVCLIVREVLQEKVSREQWGLEDGWGSPPPRGSSEEKQRGKCPCQLILSTSVSMVKNRFVCLLFTLKVSDSFPCLTREENHHYRYMPMIIECVPRSSLLAKSNSDHHLEFDNSLRLAITHSRNAVYKLMRGVKRKLMRELKRTGSQCLLWLVAPGWWIQRINSIPEATYLSLSLIQSKWKPWGMHQKYRLLRGALCASWLVQPVLSPSLNSPSVWRLRLWLMLCCVGVSLGSVSCPFPSLSHSASNETE